MKGNFNTLFFVTSIICLFISTSAFAATGADFDVPPDITDGINASGGSYINVEEGGSVTKGGSDVVKIMTDGYTITNKGVIEGSGYGIRATYGDEGGAHHVLDNYGRITGTKRGARFGDDFYVTNHEGGIIEGTSGRGLHLGDHGTVDNSGTITGGDNHAIDLANTELSDVIYNRVTGIVQNLGYGGSDGINTNGSLTIQNWGLIEGCDDAIKIDGTADITNYATGVIYSHSPYDGSSAIGIDGADFIIRNYGRIESNGDTGINCDRSGTVINHGTIIGHGMGGEDCDGIDIDIEINLDNYGSIQATSDTLGEGVTAGYGTINNHQGAEIVSGWHGVTIVGLTPGDTPPTPALGETVITNDGTISGGTGYGVYFVGNENSIDPDADFVYNQTLINSGTIIGGNGTAVQFSQADDLMVLKDGSSITGLINGNDGWDTITIETASVVNDSMYTAANFELFSKTGTGTYNANGNLYGAGSVMVAEGVVNYGNTTMLVTEGNYIGGNGRFTGNVTVANGGVITPGNSAGTLTVEGCVTFEEGAMMVFQAENATYGDLFSVDGALSATGSWTLIVEEGDFTPIGSDYVVIDSTCLDASVLANMVVELPDDWTADVIQSGNQIVLTNLVPEPATVTFIVLGLAGLTSRKRK